MVLLYSNGSRSPRLRLRGVYNVKLLLHVRISENLPLVPPTTCLVVGGTRGRFVYSLRNKLKKILVCLLLQLFVSNISNFENTWRTDCCNVRFFVPAGITEESFDSGGGQWQPILVGGQCGCYSGKRVRLNVYSETAKTAKRVAKLKDKIRESAAAAKT